MSLPFVLSLMKNKCPNSDLLDRVGLSSLVNQCLPKIACTVFNVINNEHTPKSIKDLIEQRNNKYDLSGNHILKHPKANSPT